MGAAGVLELAANLASFEDNMVHPTINLTDLDPECALDNLVWGAPLKVDRINTILNNSFGMVGINSTVIVKKIV
jgi:3-oxoacyl-[acyl-carrier-protein] synthase II